jgi:site-specific DNA recombinase
MNNTQEHVEISEQKYALLYCRVSLVLDNALLLKGETMSTDHQYAIMEEYCSKNNLIVSEKFNDLSISGKNIKDRPALQKLLSKLDKNIVVICENVARLSRETSDLMYIYKLIKSHGAELVLLDMSLDQNSPQLSMYISMMTAFNKTHNPDFNGPVNMPNSLDSPEGQLFLQMLGEIATLNRKENGNKISRCMNEAAKQGKLIKCPKFGYKVINKLYVEVPEEQKVIAYIKALLEYDSSLTAGPIARELKEQGFINKKGKPMHISTVQSIMREIQNPTMPQIMLKQQEEQLQKETAKVIKPNPYVYVDV